MGHENGVNERTLLLRKITEVTHCKCFG